jgi:hypothetical protein
VSASELVINTEPTPDQVQYLEDRIYEFNSGATGITDGEWLANAVVDDHPRGHKNLLLRKRLGESS